MNGGEALRGWGRRGGSRDRLDVGGAGGGEAGITGPGPGVGEAVLGGGVLGGPNGAPGL